MAISYLAFWEIAVTPVCTVIGSLVAAFISARVVLSTTEKTRQTEIQKLERNRELELEKAEKARQLDLYMIVFPEKFSAAKDVMSKARPLIEDIMRIYHDGARIRNERPELISEALNSVIAFNQAIVTTAWLLGDDVEDNGKRLVSQMHTVLRTTDMSFLYDRNHEEKIIESYRALSASVRVQMHLARLNSLLD